MLPSCSSWPQPEIIESDLWLQFRNWRVQDDEVATLASKLIPGYPQSHRRQSLYIRTFCRSTAICANIHEIPKTNSSHECSSTNTWLPRAPSKSIWTSSATLPAVRHRRNQIGRLTNLTQLSVDTSWGRVTVADQKPRFSGTRFQQPSNVSRRPHRQFHGLTMMPTMPTSSGDRQHGGFHFVFIEQAVAASTRAGATSQHVEVLRILPQHRRSRDRTLQTWQNKAGNAPQLTDVGIPTGVKVTFRI